MSAEYNVNIINHYNPLRDHIPTREKRVIRKAIDAILRSDPILKPALKVKIDIISSAAIPTPPTLLKVLQYALHYLTFGHYESQYIASKRLKSSADAFLLKNRLTDEIYMEHYYNIGDMESLKAMINKGNARAVVQGYPILHLMIVAEESEVVEKLYANDADIHRKNKDLKTAIELGNDIKDQDIRSKMLLAIDISPHGLESPKPLNTNFGSMLYS
ncbi:MAG: hypothetical protein WD595_02850 [Waddliaceae bacterium]